MQHTTPDGSSSLSLLTALRAHESVSQPFLITGPSKPLKETHSLFYIPLFLKDRWYTVSHMELAKCWNGNISQNCNSIDYNTCNLRVKSGIFYLNQLGHNCLYEGFWFGAEILTDHSSSTLDLNLPPVIRKPILGSVMPDLVACIKQSGSCFLLTITLRTALRIWKGIGHGSTFGCLTASVASI